MEATSECAVLDGGNKPCSLRLRVDNIPRHSSTKEVKKLLKRNLKEMEFHRLKNIGSTAFFSMSSEEDLLRATAILDKLKVKNCQLAVRCVPEEPPVKASIASKGQQPEGATKLVTPLADMSYDKQLEEKNLQSTRIFQNLCKQISQSHDRNHRMDKNCLKEILPSPVITGYRNKCEFTVAKGEDGLAVVGFVGGKMADKKISVLDVTDCINITQNTRNIVHEFQDFIRTFDERLTAFEEFKREGFWKMLTVRDFHGDCMIIVTVHPFPDKDLVKKAQRALREKFITFGRVGVPFNFRVTSLYWQTMENAGDDKVYEHLAGVPYIYESILNAHFHVSPSAFFQTNSKGAEVLYTAVIDALGLPSVNRELISDCDFIEYAVENTKNEDDQSNNDSGELVEEVENGLPDENCAEVEIKKAKVEEYKGGESTEKCNKSVVVLDICCGTGTIGICLMKHLRNAKKQKKLDGSFGCVGVEIVSEAIRDARLNATSNGFSDKNCRYIAGDAKRIFRELKYFLPDDCTWENTEILGVLDPPRAGISDHVVIDCRRLEKMRCLAYVSCDPKAAMKNLVDLCRPQSRKYEGEPFRIVSIQPVDMFPQTEHFEWVVCLQKD